MPPSAIGCSISSRSQTGVRIMLSSVNSPYAQIRTLESEDHEPRWFQRYCEREVREFRVGAPGRVLTSHDWRQVGHLPESEKRQERTHQRPNTPSSQS